MNLTIDVVYIIILTTITGSVLTIFWYFIGQVFEWTGFMNIRHLLLQGVTVFYLIPVCYIMLKYFSSMSGIVDGRVFNVTPQILWFLRILLVMWGVGVICAVVRHIKEMAGLGYRAKDAIPCDRNTQEYFDEICMELGIPAGKILLFQGYRVKVAHITGLIRPKVMLPVESYSREELRVIFLHELTHYKQGDLLLRNIMSIVRILHFFNPIVWWLNKLIQQWGEYACDYNVYQRAGGVKHYFGIITALMEDMRDDALQIHLVGNPDELEERIKHMKKFYKVKSYPKWVAAGILCVMMLMSTGTVYAATGALEDGYIKLYDASVVEYEEEMTDNNLTEYTEPFVEDGITRVVVKAQSMSRSAAAFNWSVPANTMYQTQGISASSGGTISVMVNANPTDKVLQVGIIEPDGTKRYVQSSGNIYHAFALDQSGIYRVFVQNNNSSAVSVEGTYIY